MAKGKKLAEVRKWYQDHGMEFIPSDWDDKKVEEVAQQLGGYKVMRMTQPALLERLPQILRDPEEVALAEKLEDFFAPYIAMLPRSKGELIRELVNDRKTYDQIAESNKFYDRSHAHRALKRAVQALILLIAKDSPDFQYQGRPRDYEAERAAAEQVFDRYMKGGSA